MARLHLLAQLEGGSGPGRAESGSWSRALRKTATALVAADLVLAGKGILAADESVPTMDARLRRAGVVPGSEGRRAYREMLVTGQRALANRVACNVAALQGSHTPVLEPSYLPA